MTLDEKVKRVYDTLMAGEPRFITYTLYNQQTAYDIDVDGKRYGARMTDVWEYCRERELTIGEGRLDLTLKKWYHSTGKRSCFAKAMQE